jgi:hypothetical protein
VPVLHLTRMTNKCLFVHPFCDLQKLFIFYLFFSRGVLRYFTQTWRNNSFRCLLRRLLRPQDVGHLCLRYCKFLNPFYNLNCSARERRVTENRHFSTLNVGLAETGNRTQATCLAGSVTRCSAIHYALIFYFIFYLFFIFRKNKICLRINYFQNNCCVTKYVKLKKLKVIKNIC